MILSGNIKDKKIKMMIKELRKIFILLQLPFISV